jgi:hypothetical protein
MTINTLIGDIAKCAVCMAPGTGKVGMTLCQWKETMVNIGGCPAGAAYRMALNTIF